ncbi:hypothetical protein [Streptomyces caeruleatus]|uniref:Uncharacterized protein n=1 Tax=Streptomyces caeruleatus TaxID=661399 RepID=A0A101TS00_9ACTN|nr:hypothetical protein [Streptomyces caeruleatus]KUN97374.1 hypothetical protein AQJ67_31085 [Streptomyces caeruleatus]
MVKHKSTRAEADHTVALLRAALERAGIPECEAARVRALVIGGRAHVGIGALPVGSAVKLSNALSLALVKGDVDDSSAAPAEVTG